MEPTAIQPKQGAILISEPSLRDLYFKRSVVLLTEHNEEGSFGLILNKPIEIKISKIIKDFPDLDFPIFLGGPVRTDSLFVLHTLGNQVENSIPIGKTLFWGGNMDTILQLAAENKVNEKDIRFFIGYSGWSKNQLNDELKENSWFVTKIKTKQLLNKQPDRMWHDLMIGLGNSYAIWANYPPDPLLN